MDRRLRGDDKGNLGRFNVKAACAKGGNSELGASYLSQNRTIDRFGAIAQAGISLSTRPRNPGADVDRLTSCELPRRTPAMKLGERTGAA